MTDPMEVIEDILGLGGRDDDLAARGDEIRDRRLTARRSAAETIQAAIDMLEELRGAATRGPWESGLVGVYAPDGYVASDDMWYSDRTLIVTLHRTIDAQLAILGHALSRAKSKISTGGNERSVWSHEIDAENLARAILGEAQ